MEGLGKKLKEARLARGLTLEDAYRVTKIRPNRLDAIENEDFSLFDSLTYSKAAVLIYGKFLEVDVSPYLEAFETSETVTVDGYSYLQDTPELEPVRPVKVRRRSSPSGGGGGGRSSLMPLIIGILVLVIGFTVMKWLFQMQRLKPRPSPALGTSPVATATVTDRIIAPHAQPADSTTPPAEIVPSTAPAPTATATAVPSVTPVVPAPSTAEPEVRRAEPVHPEDAAVIPTPTPTPKRSPRRTSPSPAPRLSPAPRSTVTTTPKPR
jgi:cytoskeleton protein RodZ